MTEWHSIPAPLPPSRWAFRSSEDWPDDDLVAAGGDLEPSTLIGAYRSGLFPMQLDGPEPLIGWWSPNPRGVLPLERLRVTRSLRQSRRRYRVTIDSAFRAVMIACANPTRPHGWITQPFIDAYTRLHELGWAHSIEVFDSTGALVGGLYGVKIGGVFAGESMFSVQRDASKVALVTLVDLMRASGLSLLDVQWCTPHLASLGAIEIPRTEYLARLAAVLDRAPYLPQ